MKRTQAIVIGVLLLAGLAWWWIATRNPYAPGGARFEGPQEPEPSLLDEITGGARQISGIAGAALATIKLATGLGTSAAVAAPAAVAVTFAPVAAEVGISSAAAAALPGAVAIGPAPAAAVAEATTISATSGATMALLEVGAGVGLVAGLAALGYALDWWGCEGGGCGTDYADERCRSESFRFDPANKAICFGGPAADTVGPYGGNFFDREEDFQQSGLAEYGYEWQG